EHQDDQATPPQRAAHRGRPSIRRRRGRRPARGVTPPAAPSAPPAASSLAASSLAASSLTASSLTASSLAASSPAASPDAASPLADLPLLNPPAPVEQASRSPRSPARVRRQRGTIRDWRTEWRSRWSSKQQALMPRVLKLRDQASALLRSPRRRAAAVAALVAVLALDAYLLHARSRDASGGAAERRHGGQPTLRELAAAGDRSRTGTSSPDEPSAPEYAWPVPTRPATRDRDAALEPPRNGPDTAGPSAAPAATSPLSGRQPAAPSSPLGPASPPSPISRLPRVSPPPPSPLPAPPLPPSGNAGRSGEEDEAEAAGTSAGGSSGASSGAATFPEGAPGDTGLPPAGPGARPPTPAEPDADTAPPPPPEPSSAFPPNAHTATLGSMRPQRAGDLNGSWEIQNVVSATSYPAYRGLRLTYRIVLHQDGERISGDGEKWAENGRRIPAAQRTPIHLSGEMVGREVRVRFTESGNRRDSAGSFRWRLSADGTGFAGTFASSAAAARGASAAVRLP
ncbi:MAG TPA: hypothetical protein VOA80_09885, partial [Thermoanaerobaculia bacterium]|nr:hypothetical protein [Thermoanaerobaculia bacterium]